MPKQDPPPNQSPSDRIGTFVVFKGAGLPVELQTRPLPLLQEGEILVRNEYTTLCRSDLNTYAGKRTEKCPTILGHEIVGRIAGFGPGAPRTTDLRGQSLQEGDRITWGIYSSNPDDALSRQGIPQKAKDLFKYGHEQLTAESSFHGGLSTFTQLRPHTPIVAVSESVPLPVAALINCAVATVAGAMRLAGDVAGQTVVVSGAGMLGLVACAMSAVAGAQEVIAVDVDPSRLETALQFGANRNAEAAFMQHYHRKVGLVLELSGAPAAMENSLEWLQIGGTTVWVGGTFPQRNLQISGESLIRNLSTIKGLHNYNAQDLVRSVEFIEQNHDRFPFAELVYEMHSLEQSESAFQYALEKNPFRVGLRLS
jgi:putative phosphonate catabolism associated alcohol dehydrogenase